MIGKATPHLLLLTTKSAISKMICLTDVQALFISVADLQYQDT
jgi:hypothetical protein